MVGAIHDQLPVGREERAAVVAEGRGETPHVAPVHAHGVNVEISVAQRGEDDGPAVGGQRPFGVVLGIRGEALRPRAIGGGAVQGVVVQRPDVPLRVVPARRAGRGGGRGGRGEKTPGAGGGRGAGGARPPPRATG